MNSLLTKQNCQGILCLIRQLLTLPQSRIVSIEGGGELTQFMTGKKDRPKTEPMYSGGDWVKFPISSGFAKVDYHTFISSHIRNSRRIMITQSIHNGRFSGCFATSQLYSPRPRLSWHAIPPDDSKFLKFVEGKSHMIYSLACDNKFGFSVFLMETFGTDQTVLKGTSDLKKKSDEGFRVTACAANGSSFFIVMTKDTEEYTDKAQEWFTHSTWKGIACLLDRGYKEGKGITGICYSSGSEKYFVVMTKMEEEQRYAWFQNSDSSGYARRNWMGKKYKEGFYVTIIFNDPTDNKLLIVTTQGNTLSEYLCQVNFVLQNNDGERPKRN